MIPQSPALAYAYFRLWELFFIFFFTNGNFPAILFKHHEDAPVVQLDRASDSGSECWGFESLRPYQKPGFRHVRGLVFVLTLCADLRSGFADGSPSREGTPRSATRPRRVPSVGLRPYQKRDTTKVVSLFWFPQAIIMLGVGEAAPAPRFCLRQNARTAQKRRRPLAGHRAT